MPTPEKIAELEARYGSRKVTADEIEAVFGVRPPGAPGMSRLHHLEWCKARAREYLDQGDANTALGSFFSDMRKHPDTATHGGLELGGMLMIGGFLGTVSEVRDHIEGYN